MTGYFFFQKYHFTLKVEIDFALKQTAVGPQGAYSSC